jgi:hypothetical protein
MSISQPTLHTMPCPTDITQDPTINQHQLQTAEVLQRFDMASSTRFVPNARVLDAFIRWIEQPEFDPLHAKHWRQLYLDDHEAAMCEATFWAVLADCGVQVKPNTDLTGQTQTPDFACRKNGTKFYVEVTCIRIDTATDETGLDPFPQIASHAGHYALLNKAIFFECKNKTPQCANLDAPCIVAVGTFHPQASCRAVRRLGVEWLVTGEARIAVQFNRQAGRGVGRPYQITRYDWAAFAGVSQLAAVEPKRQPISALLIGGFGCTPLNVLGALHPNPVREFDAALLHRIPFCRKAESPDGIEATEWIQVPHDWNADLGEDDTDV